MYKYFTFGGNWCATLISAAAIHLNIIKVHTKLHSPIALPNHHCQF